MIKENKAGQLPPAKARKKQTALTDNDLERICGYVVGRVCLMYDSPYLKEEVFDAAFVGAHLAREEGISLSLLWLRARRDAIRELYRLIGHRNAAGNKPKECGFKLPALFTEAMSVVYGDGEVDNPKLPPQESLYEAVDNHDFVQHLLSRLDGRRRSLLVARYFDGLSDIEIARIHNIKQGKTIADGIDNTLKMLRRLPEWQNYIDEAGLSLLADK